MIEIERGEVYYVNFRSILGSEQGGNRPCVVIQNDIGNIHSGTTIIAPTAQTICRDFKCDNPRKKIYADKRKYHGRYAVVDMRKEFFGE